MKLADIRPFLQGLRDHLAVALDDNDFERVRDVISDIDRELAPRAGRVRVEKKSRYEHVYWDARQSRWRARMRIRGEMVQLGASVDEDRCYQKLVEGLRQRGLEGLLR